MNILVVALDNLGDAVMASPLAGGLRRAIPGSRVSFWVKSYSAPVLKFCPQAETVFGTNPFWEPSQLHEQGSLSGFLETISSIRRQHYDAALILNTEWRRSLFCRMAGIPRRVGFHQRKSRYFLTQSVSRPSGNVHVLEEHRLLLEAFLGCSVDPLVPELTPSKGHQAFAGGFFLSLGPEAKVCVAIHPFCGNPVRRWPTARFTEFCSLALKRPGWRVIAFGDSAERKELQTWKNTLGEGFIISPEGFSLEENLAILSRCQAFVGLDSGFSHASAAFGVPTLALFGPSDPGRFRPVGRGTVHVLKRDSLDQLSAEEVFGELSVATGGR